MVFQAVLSRHLKSITSSAPFTKYLLVTNVLMGGCIDLCGDNICQRIIEKSKSTDWGRSGRIVAVSVSLCIPAHYWYQRLDKWFPLKTRSHIAKKIILDVFAVGPFFISGFYLGMSLLEGRSWKDSTTVLKQKFIPTFKVDVVFWPVVQVVNFYYLPTSLRLVYVNSMSLIWAIILSYFKHNDIKGINVNQLRK